MGTITALAAISLALLSFAISLYRFKKEMKKKMQYQDFIKDAEDGIFNDFASNYNYAHASTKGVAIYKKEGKYIIQSQSKLFDTSIHF